MTATNFGLYIGFVILAICMIAIAVRLLTAPAEADRAVAGDMLMFSFTGMLIMLGVLVAPDYFVDLVLVASVVGFLSAVSLARALTRGRR